MSSDVAHITANPGPSSYARLETKLRHKVSLIRFEQIRNKPTLQRPRMLLGELGATGGQTGGKRKSERCSLGIV